MDRRFPMLLVLGAVCFSVGCAGARPSGEVSSGGTTPKYGGIINQRAVTDPYDWDQTLSGKALGAGRSVGEVGYDSLMGFELGDHNSTVLGPRLAERWEVGPDAKTFTFYLKKGVKFANLPPVNGREFTSADVKFTYEYNTRSGEFKDKKDLSPGLYKWMVEGLDRIETPDGYTAVVKFKDGFSPFLNYAASDYLPIMPREIYDADGNFAKQVVGTHAFQLDPKASQPGSRWVFKKHADYWLPGRPYIDEMRWLVIPDDSSAYAAFRTKQLDLVEQDITTKAAEQIKEASSDAQMKKVEIPTAWRFYINTRRPPLNDVRIRKAISLAIDRDEYAKVVEGAPAPWGLDGAVSGNFTQEEIRKVLRYDPAEARRLVAEAGFPNGFDLEVTFPGMNYGQQYITALELLQSQFKKAGINVQLKSETKEDWSNKRRKSDYLLNLQGSAIVPGLDADARLFSSFHPNSPQNYNGIYDDKAKALIEAQRRESDQAKRRELIRQAILYLNTETYSAIGIVHGVDYFFAQSYVKDYKPMTASDAMALVHAWVDK